MKIIRMTAQILGVKESTSKKVQRRLKKVRKLMEHHLKKARSSLKKVALQHMLKTQKYFGKKILTCYDHPELPRTNNQQELVLRDARRYERRITGHKSTGRRTARDGALLVPAQQRMKRQEITATDLALVPEECWRENLRRQREQRQRYDRPRRLRKHLARTLRDLRPRLRKLRHGGPRAP
jgi:hypothetical protein